MTNAPITSREPRFASELSRAPRLRLLPKGAAGSMSGASPTPPREAESRRPAPVSTGRNGSASVLIAGQDATARARVLRELGEVMSTGTQFEEAGTFWEVLERAPWSRMVILSGDLDELSGESLLHSLAHRHPDLPVVSFEPRAAL